METPVASKESLDFADLQIPVEILGKPSERIVAMSKLATHLVMVAENYTGDPPTLVISDGDLVLRGKPIAGCYYRENKTKPVVRIGERSLNEVWGSSLINIFGKLKSLTTLFIVAHEVKHFIDDKRGLLTKFDPGEDLSVNYEEHYSYRCEQDALESSVETVNTALGVEVLTVRDKTTGRIGINNTTVNLCLLAKEDRMHRKIMRNLSK